MKVESFSVRMSEKSLFDQTVAFKRNLVFHYHQYLPLVIVNYKQGNSRHSVTDLYRGICFDTNSRVVVARGLDRFGNADSLKEILYYETKEDGTMILLYWFQDQWIVQCRHNFGDDTIPSGRCTYRQLFLEIAQNDFTTLERDKTYMFEMCSLENRIVQPYPNATIFLLAIVETCSGKEIEITAEFEKQNRWFSRPQIIAKLPNFASLPFTQEGFIARRIDGSRQKCKNFNYLLMSKIKYRGPYIGNAAVKTLLKYTSRELLEQELLSLGIPSQEFSILFAQQDPTTFDHKPEFCAIKENKKEEEDVTKPQRSSDGSWIVSCTCGKLMDFIRLKRDHIVPSLCHCGQQLGFYKIPCGNLAYRCAACNNTHEALQEAVDGRRIGEPRGFPCTARCKIYRLHLHSLIDNHPTIKKSDCYKEMALILGKSGLDAHISRFTIDECKKCIEHFSKA